MHLVHSTLLAGLGLSVATVGATAIFQYRIGTELRQDAQSLRADIRPLSALQLEHDHLAENFSQTYPSVHDERANDVPSNDDTSRSAAESPSNSPLPLFHPRIISASNLKPVAQWANVGQATPAAAIETQSWAFQTGNFTVAAQTIALDENARAKVQSFLDGLNPEQRAKYASAEYAVARLLGVYARDFAGVRFGNPIVHDADEVTMWTLWTYRDGHGREHDLHLHNSAQGWQRVISDPEESLLMGLAQLEVNPR